MGDQEQEDVEEEEEEDKHFVHEGLQQIGQLLHKSEVLESPIDIHLPKTTPLNLPHLEWFHMEIDPRKVKLTNSGHTIIYSAKWLQERPYISGGPFVGKYIFSQFHFHWGSNNMSGSEHTISGVRQILEMHLVFFKSCYLTQENALKRKDGIAVVVVLFKLQDERNESIMVINDALSQIREPHTSTRLKNVALDKYMEPFSDDYFLYVGSVNTASCVHYVLWMICRTPLGITMNQVESFRTLKGSDGAPLLQNWRELQPLGSRLLYHVNPSGQLHSTLLILKKEIDPTMQRLHQTTKYPRSSREYSDPTGTTI